MKRLAAAILIGAMLSLAAAASVPSAEAQGIKALPEASQCADVLKRLRLERRDVVFVGCETRQAGDPDADRLEARYRVAGKDLARVEVWFMRRFHGKKLRFVCCGWETPPVWFKARDGAEYELAFGGETSVARREDWVKLPYLTLTVTRDTGAP